MQYPNKNLNFLSAASIDKNDSSFAKRRQKPLMNGSCDAIIRIIFHFFRRFSTLFYLVSRCEVQYNIRMYINECERIYKLAISHIRVDLRMLVTLGKDGKFTSITSSGKKAVLFSKSTSFVMRLL